MRLWVRLLALCALVAVATTFTAATSQAAAGDRTVDATALLQWDFSPAITSATDITVSIVACDASLSQSDRFNCFVAGIAPGAPHATLTDGPTAVPTTTTYSQTLSLDSTKSYIIGSFADIDLDPTVAFKRNRVIFSPAQFASLPAGTSTDPVALGGIDTSYVTLHGVVTYSGPSSDSVGAGACPSTSLFNGQTCEGLAISYRDPTTHAYTMNLWPGDYRAAGFTPNGGLPILGIVNLLSFPVPSTAEEQSIALDFNADVAFNGAAAEAAVGDGNFDGTTDSNQLDVTSVQLTDGSYVTIDANGTNVATAVAQPLVALVNAPPPDAPFASGIGSFTVGPLPLGTDAVLDLYFQTAPPAGSEYWKYVNGVWGAFPTTVLTTPHYVVHLTITDGGVGDYDGVENGYVTDPFGLEPPYSVAPAGITIAKRTGATVSWTLTAGGASIAAAPAGTAVSMVCGRKAPVDLTSSLVADGSGGYSVLIARPHKGCIVTMTVPTTATPGSGTRSSSQTIT